MHFPIYFRKDTGYWYVDLRSIGHGQRSLKTKLKREALSLTKLLEQNHRTIKSPGRRVAIEQFESEYLAFSASTKAPATMEKERSTLKLFRRLLPDVRFVQEVTPRVADRFVERMTTAELEYPRYKDGKKYTAAGHVSPTVKIKKRLAVPSVNSYLASIRSIFSTAVRWQYIEDNPFRGAQGVPENDLPARILTMEEIRSIFQATARHAPELLELWEFYVLTGARRSEALNLEWTEIDFDRGTITLIKTKGKSKRKKKYRKLIMRPRVREILISRRPLAQPFPFKPHRVTSGFKRMAKAAGITDPGITLHSLRSTFVSYIQDAGMPVGFVSWIVGHASESITHTEYTGFYGEMIAGYFSTFEQKLLPAIGVGKEINKLTQRE